MPHQYVVRCYDVYATSCVVEAESAAAAREEALGGDHQWTSPEFLYDSDEPTSAVRTDGAPEPRPWPPVLDLDRKGVIHP